MVELSENAKKVAESRYFMEGEDWDKCSLRVADVIASNEKDKELYQKQFYEIISNMNFIPGGRILRNAGRLRGSLFNCYLLPIEDSIESIGQCKKEALQLWSSGGGVGFNFSTLRPKNAPIKGIGGKSSGLVSFLKTFNSDADVIKIGGGRRAAAIGIVDISHPEVLDFMDAKLKDGDIPNFNLSIAINKEFIDAVVNDLDWEFKFSQKSYGFMKAKHVWDKILTNMLSSGEPGLINFDNLRKNNSYYFAPIVGTNVCGEATLESGGVCDLGSIVLPNIITGQQNTNWIKLEKTARLAVRFLDNIIDINKYVLDINKSTAQNGRRLGIGVMGFAEYLFMKNIRYGSEKAMLEIDRLMSFIRNTVYDESVNLAIEKGSFPAFDSSLFCESSFVRKLPAKLRMRIRQHGIRNCSLLALAPTGTISLIADKTSGIEPLSAKAFLRSDAVGDRIYIHHMYRKFIDLNEPIPDWYVDAYDLLPEDHFSTQACFQQYVDGAISKTILLPKNASKDALSLLLLEYIRDLKGCTVYRDGSKEGQPINALSMKEIKDYINKEKSDSYLLEEDVQCKSGSCEI